jgi:hypothetical protein
MAVTDKVKATARVTDKATVVKAAKTATTTREVTAVTRVAVGVSEVARVEDNSVAAVTLADSEETPSELLLSSDGPSDSSPKKIPSN